MVEFGVLRGSDSFLDTLRALKSTCFLVETCGDGGFRMAYISEELQRLTGIVLDDVADTRIDRLFPARMAAALAENYERALAADGPILFDEAHRLKAADTWWRTTLSRAPNGPSGQQRLVGFSCEISDIIAREARLVADRAELQLAHGDVQMLAGLTAHDMRAPLANVVSLLAIVLENFRDLGDGKRDMILTCRDVARSSIDAIDLLMDRIVPDPETETGAERVDLGQVCATVAALVDPAGALRITHPINQVESDPVVLHACLRNLMDNAAKHARSYIEISLEELDRHDLIRLSVRDDGPGIPEGTDPVALATRTSAPTRGGFGLAAILRLLESQGGKLTFVRNGAEPGVTFRADLPGRIMQNSDRAA